MARTTPDLDPGVLQELKRRSRRERKTWARRWSTSKTRTPSGRFRPRPVSVTIDANVLVYASNRSDPVQAPAAALIERLAAGPELFYAMDNVARLLLRRHVRVPGEADGFWQLFRNTALDRVRGNHVPDAHIASLMLQHGVRTIYSRDRGFRRFEGVRVIDPFR